MTSTPWFRFFPSDWLGGTGDLSATEKGVYITLIAMMYDHGEPVPEDHHRLMRRCGLSNIAAFSKVLDALLSTGKIIRTLDGLFNERVRAEVEFSSQKSAVAKQSANQRWQGKDKKNKPPTDANASPAHSVRNANQKPEPDISSLRSDISATPSGAAAIKTELASVLDPLHVAAVIDHRQRLRKPLTAHAAHLLAAKFAMCVDANEAADTMISNGWQGFEPAWMHTRVTGKGQAPPREPTLSEYLREQGRKLQEREDARTIETDYRYGPSDTAS